MNKADILIIGSGPAGHIAAEVAGDSGLSVYLFEKDKLGGVCLNYGCIPTKTLLNSAKIIRQFQDSDKYGIDVEGYIQLNHEEVIKRKDKVVRRMTLGLEATLRDKATIIKGEAKILPKEDEEFVVEANGEKYYGKYLFIATGSDSIIPPIEGLKEAVEKGFAITSKEALELEEVPENLVIVGAGVIGLELADYYSAAGSKVTVIEKLDKVLPSLEEEVASILRKSLEKKGIKIHLASTVTKIGEKEVHFIKREEDRTVEADKVLVAVGRKGATKGFGLENLSIEMNGSFIKTDEYLRASENGVFAIGDVNGKSLLAHAAQRQAISAVKNLTEDADKVSSNSVPSVVYTTPAVASVGYTLEQALDADIDAKEVKLSLLYSGRYVAENIELTGICKIVYDRTNRCLIGAHIVGSYSSEIIAILASFIDLKTDVKDIEKIVFPHPTVGEVIHDAVATIAQKIAKHEKILASATSNGDGQES